MAYDRVNGAWPAGTNNGRDAKPTPQEATAGARRLYRKAIGRAFRGRVKITSGNRITWIRSGVLYVNPDERGGGWHEIVHSISHYAARRLYGEAHGTRHAWIERELIDYVVASGWLAGALRRPAKITGPVDIRAARAARVAARLKAWEAKERRARRAAAKLRASLRRYNKDGIGASA